MDERGVTWSYPSLTFRMVEGGASHTGPALPKPCNAIVCPKHRKTYPLRQSFVQAGVHSAVPGSVATAHLNTPHAPLASKDFTTTCCPPQSTAACQPTSTGRRTCSSTRGCGGRASHQNSLQQTTICASAGHRWGMLRCTVNSIPTAKHTSAYTWCSPQCGCLQSVKCAQRMLIDMQHSLRATGGAAA